MKRFRNLCHGMLNQSLIKKKILRLVRLKLKLNPGNEWPIVRLSQSVIQIVWSRKKSTIGRLPKMIPIVWIFWIVFSTCLTCILFVDLSTAIKSLNPNKNIADANEKENPFVCSMRPLKFAEKGRLTIHINAAYEKKKPLVYSMPINQLFCALLVNPCFKRVIWIITLLVYMKRRSRLNALLTLLVFLKKVVLKRTLLFLCARCAHPSLIKGVF